MITPAINLLQDQKVSPKTQGSMVLLELIQADGLENHVGQGGFIQDPEGIVIDHDQGTVGTSLVIKEDFAFPGLPVICAHTDGHVLAVGFAFGIGEKEQVFAVFGFVGKEAGHADRFDQGTVVSRVYFPGFPKVLGHGDSAAIGCGFVRAIAVVADIEHQSAI